MSIVGFSGTFCHSYVDFDTFFFFSFLWIISEYLSFLSASAANLGPLNQATPRPPTIT